MKLALTVGINTYPGATNLNLCVSDSARMKQLLLDRGFAVTELLDRAATKAAILAALEHLAEIAMPGDRVLIHLSGHGTQVPCRNGDETDGRDEAFCPTDYPQVITDDEFATVFHDFREGVVIDVVADCCHAGTLDRDLRLTPRFIVPPDGVLFEPAPRGLFAFLDEKPVAARVCLLSGCRADQTSGEGDYALFRGGILSQLFVIANRTYPGATREEIHEEILAQIKLLPGVKQEPQLTGPELLLLEPMLPLEQPVQTSGGQG